MKIFLHVIFLLLSSDEEAMTKIIGPIPFWKKYTFPTINSAVYFLVTFRTYNARKLLHLLFVRVRKNEHNNAEAVLHIDLLFVEQVFL